MKRSVLAVVLCIPMCAVAQSATPAATISTFITAFNKGDLKTVAGLHTANATIIDEMPPHIWQRPKAVEEWLEALAAEGKSKQQSENAVSVTAPQVLTTSGTSAYAVVPAVYTYKEHGIAMRETSTITLAMHKTAGTWKIQGWSWNGTVPQKASR